MKRKHILIRALLLLLPLALWSSCKKSFLEVPPQGVQTEAEVAADPNAAQFLVNGVYNSLYLGGFGDNTVGMLWALATDVASDDADKGSSPDDFTPLKEIDNFTLTSNNFIFNNIWRGHYQGIARANRTIDVLSRATFDTATRNRYLGEVRFIRALYYFDLVRMFGGVPLVLRVPSTDDLNNDDFNVRRSRDSVYAAIIADLQFAANNLPQKGAPETQPGRATKGAAQALLSKVYLYQQNWQGALDLARAVIDSGKYSLDTSYFHIFREAGNNNSESIFEVQTSSANCGLVSELYSNSQGPRARMGWNDLGFGFNVPTSDLVNAYESGDRRRNASIIFITPTIPGNSPGTVLFDGFRIPSQDSVENPRYNYKVYHSNTAESPSCAGVGDKDKKPQNIRILRYAEVLLIYAEAAVHLGVGDGADKLNLVRARAGLGPVPNTIDNVLHERRVELALENNRFFDLVRTGQAGTVLRAQGKPFVDNKNELFPIPQPQIDLSGGRLTQNPGY